MIPPAKRLQSLTRYVFEELFQMKSEALAAGKEVFDLGVGNPDGRPPAHVVEALIQALHEETSNYHRYSAFNCLPELRKAIANWYERRFAVHLDPMKEVQPLVGSKEGLYHLMQAYLDTGDTILIPTPCYPAYLGAARLAEANIVEMPLIEDNDFLIRFDEIAEDDARAAKLMLMNYPNNPTGATCTLDHYRDALAFCRDFDILLVSDIAYSELSLTEDHTPSSVLELPGSREQAIEFQSLSKSHSMAGWRVGFCVGNQEAVGNLLKLKSNVDFGIFMAVQKAAEAALTGDDSAVAANRRMYRGRRDRFCNGLKALGWDVRVPEAAMYIWTRVPEAYGQDDWRFVKELFQASGVLLSPGSGFGETGKGYVRISLIIDEAAIDTALARIKASGILKA